MSTNETAPTVYRSAAVQAAVAGERKRLQAHQPAPGTTRCKACSGVAPCVEARAATDFLVERGIPPIRIGTGELIRLAARRRLRAAARRRERRLLARCSATPA